jgi:hypothetical protein
MKTLYCVLLALALAFLTSPAGAAVYFQDNFDSYTTEGEFAAAGWLSTNTVGAAPAPLPPGPGTYEIIGPVGSYPVQSSTANWLVIDTFYTWQKLISAGPPPVYETRYSYSAQANPPTRNGQPTTGNQVTSNSDWAPLADIPNSGASHDLYTPTFSTGDNPNLHVSINFIESKSSGKAVAMIDASADGGATWNTVWQRSSVGRRSTAGGGETGGGLCTTYLEDHTNCGGYYGVLDLNLASVANQANVQLRFRQYEPNDDWMFTIDDLVVDDNPGPQKGPFTKFAEDFSNGGVPTIGGMTVEGAWDNDPGAQYLVGMLPQNQKINRINWGPDLNNPNFCAAVTQGTSSTHTWMMTPVLDCSDLTKVMLAYDDEVKAVNNTTGLQEVLVMQDSDGDGVAESTDAVLGSVFKYQTGAFQRGNEDANYQERVFEVAEAAGLSNVFFAFHNNSNSTDPKYFWAVDNISVTGVPEPSTIALLVGAALMGLVAYRRRG